MAGRVGSAVGIDDTGFFVEVFEGFCLIADNVGPAVGNFKGFCVNFWEGFCFTGAATSGDGSSVGFQEGFGVVKAEGLIVGSSVGRRVGSCVGSSVGRGDGSGVDFHVGFCIEITERKKLKTLLIINSHI